MHVKHFPCGWLAGLCSHSSALYSGQWALSVNVVGIMWWGQSGPRLWRDDELLWENIKFVTELYFLICSFSNDLCIYPLHESRYGVFVLELSLCSHVSSFCKLPQYGKHNLTRSHLVMLFYWLNMKQKNTDETSHIFSHLSITGLRIGLCQCTS